jgi:hypothetical protein
MIPIRSWASSTILPITHEFRRRAKLLRHRADWFLRDCEVLSLRAFVAALQRLDGANALPT